MIANDLKGTQFHAEYQSKVLNPSVSQSTCFIVNGYETFLTGLYRSPTLDSLPQVLGSSKRS